MGIETTRLFVDSLMLGVQLADVSTRWSSHPQGKLQKFPASSCADIYQGHPSGYYWLNVTNEPQLVHCSLNENRCCNESDGKLMHILINEH